MTEQILTPDGSMSNPDNDPPITSKHWRELTRAALIQQRKALQEQVRAVGMQIAALENIDKPNDNRQSVV